MRYKVSVPLLKLKQEAISSKFGDQFLELTETLKLPCSSQLLIMQQTLIVIISVFLYIFFYGIIYFSSSLLLFTNLLF